MTDYARLPWVVKGKNKCVQSLLGYLVNGNNHTDLIYLVSSEQKDKADGFFKLIHSIFGVHFKEVKVSQLNEEHKGIVLIKDDEVEFNEKFFKSLRRPLNFTPVVFATKLEVIPIEEFRKIIPFPTTNPPIHQLYSEVKDVPYFREFISEGITESSKPKWPPFIATLASSWNLGGYQADPLASSKKFLKICRKETLDKMSEGKLALNSDISLALTPNTWALNSTDCRIPMELVVNGPWADSQRLHLIELRFEIYVILSDLIAKGEPITTSNMKIIKEQLRGKISEQIKPIVWNSCMDENGYSTRLAKFEEVILSQTDKMVKSIERKCAKCEKEGAIKGCPCKCAYYCCKSCQKEDWDKHKRSKEHKEWKAIQKE
jgi:hypothetical protein